jgi:hypothetical protein
VSNRSNAVFLLDHFVGTLLKVHRHDQTERLSRSHVDYQLELNRCLDGKVARLCAFEDAIGIGRCASKTIG